MEPMLACDIYHMRGVKKDTFHEVTRVMVPRDFPAVMVTVAWVSAEEVVRDGASNGAP